MGTAAWPQQEKLLGAVAAHPGGGRAQGLHRSPQPERPHVSPFAFTSHITLSTSLCAPTVGVARTKSLGIWSAVQIPQSCAPEESRRSGDLFKGASLSPPQTAPPSLPAVFLQDN